MLAVSLADLDALAVDTSITGGVYVSPRLEIDESGFPVLLADVPNAGVSKLAIGQRSGNPRHDTRSGKFGSGGGKQRAPTIPPPANVDPLEFARMTDAVRDAAREFDDFDEGDALEFLKARAKDPSVIDIQQFLQLVRQQHITDLVDILDNQLRSSGVKPFGRRKVKVTAPRGYARRAVSGLTDDEVAEIMHRLESRGHTTEDVDDFFDKRRPANGDAKGKRNAIAASTQWSADLIDEALYEVELGEIDHDNSAALAVHLAQTISENIKMPEVRVEPNIYVQVPAEKPKKIIRDSRGLISEVIPDEESGGEA
jgi:hypothetical protein